MKIKVNITTIDNYLLIVAAFLATIAAELGGLSLGLAVLGIGSLIKAVGSALIEGESLGQNLDNVALGVAGALTSMLALIGDPTIATAVMVIGFILKSIGSLYQRGDSISQNLDNIALGSFAIIAAVLPAYGLGAYSYYVLAVGALVKAIGSNGLRTTIAAMPPTVSATPTSVNASVSVSNASLTQSPASVQSQPGASGQAQNQASS